MPNDQLKRLGRDLAGRTTKEGGNGRKVWWGHADDLPQVVGCENTEIRKTKAGKKADNKKKEREEKERGTGTRALSKYLEPSAKVHDLKVKLKSHETIMNILLT